MQRGGQYGILTFSVDEVAGRLNDNLSLFASNAAGVWVEKPLSAGGLVVPLVYADGYLLRRKVTTLAGGPNRTVIPWNADSRYEIMQVAWPQVSNMVPGFDAVVAVMNAHKNGDPTLEASETVYWDLYRRAAKT